MSTDDAEQLVISDDGISLPAIEVLTGRGVIFGKSGSGKSNSASVIIEELLERGFPLLIVDIEGEYYTLKERYEVVHIGATDKADMPLRETEPEKVVDLCLDRNRPVIIDLSEVMDMDPAERFVDQVVTVLFSREKEARKPFLLIVEEIHEFLPQQGGLDDLGETLIRVAKRGRKRGLGLTGMSQRPAAVDKDFITQCDWLVWHRLTWKNDTQVVQSILGSEKASQVQELATGEAIMMTDWDEMIRTVQFRRKYTYDAANTPTLSPEDRPDLTNDGSASAQAVADQAANDDSDATASPAAAASNENEGEPNSGTDAAAEDAIATTVEEGEPPADAEAVETVEPEPDESPPDSTSRRQATETAGETPPQRGSNENRSGLGSASASPDANRTPAQSDGGDDLHIKSYDPPDRNRSEQTDESVTDVPKTHADPPFDDGDSRTALWEFGQLVSYVVAALLAFALRTGRYLVDIVRGETDEPFDPLEPVGSPAGPPPVSRDQMVLIITGLMLLVVLLLGFVVS